MMRVCAYNIQQACPVPPEGVRPCVFPRAPCPVTGIVHRGTTDTEVVWFMDELKTTEPLPQPVQATGGSSPDYYAFDMAGVTFQTGDVIRGMFGNDFDFGNCLKALRRIYQVKQGRGKPGVSIDYDINKIQYFLEQIKEHI